MDLRKTMRSDPQDRNNSKKLAAIARMTASAMEKENGRAKARETAKAKARANASAGEPVTAVVPVAATADPAADPPSHLSPGGEQSSPGRFFLNHPFCSLII
jgi:hypothetical protein